MEPALLPSPQDFLTIPVSSEILILRSGCETTMSAISAEGITKRFGAETVLRDVTLQVSRGDRIALIGVNGCGKSTLLKVLMGIEEPNDGRVKRASSAKIGYLAQEPELKGDITLYEAMLEAKRELREKEHELRALEAKLSEHSDDEELLHRYDEVMESYRHAGGYEYESEIHQVLAGLGFWSHEAEQPIAQLSGGERARAALAKLLLEEPEILLLDEPTNHLDFAALEWLEEYLSSWKGGFILSSHDRFMIDKLASRIWELEAGQLTEYPGNYSKYRAIKTERVGHQQKRFDEQQELIKKSEEFIRRNIAGGRFREAQAKARRKQLERLEIVQAPTVTKSIHFSIPMGEPSGRHVLHIQDLVIGYSSSPALFRLSNAALERGERAALIGPNGCGKTTLLRVLTGEFAPLQGTFKLGHNVSLSYVRQSQWEELSSDQTVLHALMAGKHQTISEARDFLGLFLFSDDDVHKRLHELSGGERSRVALARLAQLGGNFLVLDEPTNHLDLSSREVLQEALQSYEGTVLFVSHDRYLIQAFATQIWEIRDGECRIYRGNYEYYLRRRAEEGSQRKPQEQGKRLQDGRREKSNADHNEKVQQKERRRLETREAELSMTLTELEGSITQLEGELQAASYAQDHERIRELNQRYQETKAHLAQVFQEWTAVMEELQRPQQSVHHA